MVVGDFVCYFMHSRRSYVCDSWPRLAHSPAGAFSCPENGQAPPACQVFLFFYQYVTYTLTHLRMQNETRKRTPRKGPHFHEYCATILRQSWGTLVLKGAIRQVDKSLNLWHTYAQQCTGNREVVDSDSKGQRFESSRAHQLIEIPSVSCRSTPNLALDYAPIWII